MKYNKNNKYGFTLVELLAVIVILAIILVIAVPKVMSVIEDSKKATLESTAKMIASAAEKSKVQNTVLGKTEEITCDSVAKINNIDYDACSIDFVDNTASVNITGKGKFEGLYICKGTKTEAMATNEECEPNGILLPEIGITLEDCTWKQIKAIGEAGKADEYFQLGDTKTINMGSTYGNVVMEIVAFDADEKADGSGKAAITWISKNLLNTQRAMNPTRTSGDWESTEMRSWLQGDFYNTLPDDIQKSIVKVIKASASVSGGFGSLSTSEDNIWIPSYFELFGGDDCEGSYANTSITYVDYFANNSLLIKKIGNIEAPWWLRSVYGTEKFRVVNVSGTSISGTSANQSIGVAFGFCTG